MQVTDCHLYADTQKTLLGLNTQFSLDQVLQLVGQQNPAIDAIVATGDLAQDASAAAYARLFKQLHHFAAPIYWMKGNHDDLEPMLASFAAERARVSPCVAELGDWSIVLLDSTIPGRAPGVLYQQDLDFLEQALANARGKHLLVSMHHHPISMGSAWLDAQVIANADKLFAILDAEPRVRGLLWGHVHQAYDGWHANVKLMSTPSTCVQFKPGSDDFVIDTKAPGYRWLDLHADGRIDTAVERIDPIEFTLDMSSPGY